MSEAAAGIARPAPLDWRFAGRKNDCDPLYCAVLVRVRSRETLRLEHIAGPDGFKPMVRPQKARRKMAIAFKGGTDAGSGVA
jgi:hypothetical protein